MFPFQTPGQNCPARKAFTLIELLVIIAIIALLAAILFPVFARARENARRSSCASNMKQLALSVRQYVDDNDGRSLAAHAINGSYSVSAIVWDPIDPYMKNDNLLFCPSAPKFKDPWAPGNAFRASHYAFPTNWTQSAAFITVSSAAGKNPSIALPMMDLIYEPARTCLFTEIMGTSNYDVYGWGGQVFYANTGGGIFTYRNPTRHLEGANYAYLDGHVKWLGNTVIPPVFVEQQIGSNEGMTVAAAPNYPVVFAWKP